MRVVNWLNHNQGFVMAILTFVYVIATITLVGLSAKAIQPSLQTAALCTVCEMPDSCGQGELSVSGAVNSIHWDARAI
jgi:hypothetical protein